MNAGIALNNLTAHRSGPFSLKLLFSNYPEKIALKGEVIAHRNRKKEYIYFLESGIVKSLTYYPVQAKEVANGYFVEGDLMNLEAWANNQVTIPNLRVTSTKAILKMIPIDAFRELIWKNKALNQLVLTTFANRLNKNYDRLHRILLFNSRRRVIQFLIDYVEDAGQKVGYEYVIKRPFTHEEIGNLSDTSRQTVTTVLNELRAMRLIHFTRRYILIRDLEALEAVAKSNGV